MELPTLALQGSIRTESTATFTYLDWLVIGYVILLPMQFSTPIGLRFAPSDLCLLLYLLLNVFRFRIVKSTWSLWHYGMLLIFMIGTIVSLFENGTLSSYVLAEKDFGLVMLFLGYAMIASYTSDWERLRKLVCFFILSTVIQNTVAIAAFFLEKLTGIAITWLNYQSTRLSGMLVDPNAYGGLLALVFALHLMTSGKKNPLIKGWLGTFCTITLGIGIVLTFSRSSWIGLAMIILGVGLFRPLYVLRVLAVGAVTFVSIYLVLGGDYFNVITQMATRQSQITARLDYMNVALARFAEMPIFGVGVGTFQEQYQWIVHNTTVWFLTEMGLVGFVTLIGFLLWFFIRGFVAFRHADETQRWLIFGLLLGHLAMYGLSMGIEALYQRHWWLVMGLIAASYSLVKKEGGTRRWMTSSNFDNC